MRNQKFLSPPQIARLLRTSSEQVLAYIRLGELRAVNLSLTDRPRWKVDPAWLDDFLAGRSNQKPTPKRDVVTIGKPEREWF